MGVNLEGVYCFKCEVIDKHVPADLVVEYMGIETPICKKCYDALLKLQGREYIKAVHE